MSASEEPKPTVEAPPSAAPQQPEGSHVDEHGVPLDLRRAAEAEMRRVLDDEPAAKRLRTGAAGGAGRFDYAAPAQLSEGAGVAGFVITCHMGREHSAIKEVGPILVSKAAALLGIQGARSAAAAATGAAAAAAPSGAEAEQEAEPEAAAAATDEGDEAPGDAEAAAEAEVAEAAAADSALPLLHSIKLGCRGVVALRLALPAGCAGDASKLVLRIVESIIGEVESGARARFRWVQRVAPMQTTAAFEADALRAAAARLAAAVAAAEAGAAPVAAACAEGSTGAAAAPEPLAFAVAYCGRGSDSGSGGGGGDKAKERSAMIGAIADGFSDALKSQHGLETKVNLKAPAWVLLAEVLPQAGRSHVGLAVLPARLCSFQNKTNVKPVGDTTPGQQGGRGGGKKRQGQRRRD